MDGLDSASVLPNLLGEIYLGGRTGVLRLSGEGEKLGLRFRKGRLVRALAAPGQAPPPLPFPSPGDELGRHLARVLTELGLERRRTGNGDARPFARAALLDALAWRDSAAAFAEEDVVDELDQSLALSTEDLVLEAIRRLPNSATVRAALGNTNRPLGLAVNPDFDRELTPTDAYILSRVDGKVTAAEVIQLVPQDTEHTERSLLGLLLTGVVEFVEVVARPAPPAPSAIVLQPEAAPRVPPPQVEIDDVARAKAEPRRREVQEAYEGLAWKNHFEVLGVLEGANEGDIKQAYFRQAKRFHPDQYRDPGFADMTDRVEAVFMRIAGAYEALRDPESRQSYETTLRRRRGTNNLPLRPSLQAEQEEVRETQVIDSAENAWMAEEAIHRAERLILDEKVWDAIQLLQAIIPRIYGRKQRDRARVLLARAYIKNPNWLRRGEELLQTIIQEDPQFADAHFVLGLLYKESGMSSRAITLFKKALELKPEHKHAQAELKELSTPALLRKLFGKG
jgi:curved DNA-binding protein CbpA